LYKKRRPIRRNGESTERRTISFSLIEKGSLTGIYKEKISWSRRGGEDEGVNQRLGEKEVRGAGLCFSDIGPIYLSGCTRRKIEHQQDTPPASSDQEKEPNTKAAKKEWESLPEGEKRGEEVRCGGKVNKKISLDGQTSSCYQLRRCFHLRC